MMDSKPLRRGRRPDRHHTVNPALIVTGISRLVTFLVRTFDAVEVRRMVLPNGAIIQAEVTIDDSLVMIMAPRHGAGPMPCSLGIYADDVDSTYTRAMAEGARSIQEPVDQFYGHRTARIEDPAGNQWTIHTVIEEVSPEELLRRSARIVGRKSN
jgi:PhnB protein